MKALHVFYRIFHYFALWFFILAGLIGAYTLYVSGALLAAGVQAYQKAAEVNQLAQGELAAASQMYSFGFIALILLVVAIVCMAAAHIFKMSRNIVAKRHKEECCCCRKECEAPASDLDEQVEEIMKWKNLYVEGIITEREFIDKRNEILRLSK